MRGVAAIGFDIEPGGSYSVVGVDEEGHVVFKQEGVSLPRLIRLVWEYRPRLLACDNIYELSEDENLLRKILSMLPDGTEVVQVTKRPEGGFADIRSMAALAGLHVEGKLSPLKTALLAALLALKGYGSRVIFTEEKTKIVIAAAHHGSAGGMSQARYQRGVKASILRATRVIKRLLDRHGFDYDLVFRKSGYGLESAVFIVYAPRSALRGIIRRFRGRDIRVEIRPVYTGRIQFEAIRTHQEPRKYIIVGVDPGIVTAVAAVDLRGNPVFVYSRKGLDRAEIIELVKRHGIPVMVATDVTPPPDTVKKLAASLGVPLYTPPASLTIDEKHELVSSYLAHYGLHRLNSHERDALAAAIRAYREYAGKFRQIEAAAARYPAEISIDNLKASVIRGATIAEAVEREIERMLTEIPPTPLRRVRHPQQKPHRSDVVPHAELQRVIDELEAAKAKIRVLEDRLRTCAEEKKELENRVRLMQLEATSKAEEKLTEYRLRVEALQREVERLRSELDRLRSLSRRLTEALAAVATGALHPIPRIPSLTPKAIRALTEKSTLFHHTRMLYAEAAGSIDDALADALKAAGTVAVFLGSNGVAYQTLSSLLRSYAIPVVYVPQDDILAYDELVLLPQAYVEQAILEKMRLLDELAAERRRSEPRLLDFDSLKALVESYRRARLQSLAEGEEA